MKVDAPSGTALYIADEINKVFENNKEYIYGRHSKNDKRETKHIGIHAIRGGTIVGKHDVMFIGTDEIVTLAHEAQSRKVFAMGSIRAAKYIKDKKNGFYNMDNILGKDYAVTTVSSTADTTLITILSITSQGFSKMLKDLSDNGINLDMISRMTNDKGSNSVSFTLPSELKAIAYKIIKDLNISYTAKEVAAKLLIAGAGMVHQCGVAEEVFTLLNEIGTVVYAVTTSETEISCCIDAKARLDSEKMLRNHYGIKI
jgi:4-hydroxy-tetrahydrodipicolinate reductase